MTFKADLHVHSQFSNRPSMWALRRFNCPESYTTPLSIYETARKRGMSYTTITDHNSISGAQQIAHLPGTFLSTELTTYFPENGCKIHVVALGVDESHFDELMVLRKNVYELVDYLVQERIAHFQAHPLYDINGKLSVEMVEKFMLLFNVFEGINGARARQYNDLLAAIANSMTPEGIDDLANRHNIAPHGAWPWAKSFVGGSDDHSGMYVAQTYCETECGTTLEEFLASVREGRTTAGGEHGTALTLAHSIYAIAYKFFSRESSDRRLKSYPFLGAMLANMFGDGATLTTTQKLKLAISRALPEIYPGGNRSRRLEEVLDREIRQLLMDKSFRDQLSATTFNRRIFVAASHLANRLLYLYTKKLMSKQLDGGIMDLVNSFSTIGFVHLATAPYYIAHKSQNRSKPMMAEMRQAFEIVGAEGPEKMALFTDTLTDVNGVAITINRLIKAAPDYNTELTVIGCSNQPTEFSSHVRNFQAIGDFSLPEYEDLQVHFPPILDVLDYVAEEGFTRVHISTPGIQGLLGLLVARLNDLPVSGTYHTDIPQYIGRLTADQSLEENAWNYIIWFYSQLDEVFVPSCATRDQLLKRGLSPEKLKPLPRWVDTDRFHPHHARPDLWPRYGRPHGTKLLYAGRVSREKNLSLLVDSFKELADSGLTPVSSSQVTAPIGPRCKRRSEGYDVLFTGFLSQQDLAAVYASCDVFVFPSTTDTFGNVVLEAQASGLPVIVTDQGGPQELLHPGESGLIVESNNRTALSRAIRFLVESPSTRARMSQRAREFALDGRLGVETQFSTIFGEKAEWSWIGSEPQTDLAANAV